MTTLKKYLKPLLKFAFIIILITYLAKKGFISVQATRQALSQRDLIIPALLCLLATNLLGVFRWQWLLQAQNIQIRWVKTFQLTFIGNFFNITLPGAVSGDFVKAFYVGKLVQGEKTRAFGSILFDRVAGLSALVFVSAGALLVGFQAYLHSPLFRAVQALLTTAAACVFIFYTYLFFVREHHDPVLKILRHLESKISLVTSLTRVYISLRHYHSHRFVVLKVLSISILIHMAVGWSCYQFAQALGVNDLSLLSLYVIVPLGLLVTAVPIAPAGVGTGNVAFLYLFHLLGTERGADIFSLYAMAQIGLGCLGGLIYFYWKTEQTSQSPQAIESVRQ